MIFPTEPVVSYRIFLGLYCPENPFRAPEVTRELALAVVSRTVAGFTAYDASGFWNGQSERSLVVETFCPASAGSRRIIMSLAEELRAVCGQEAVMVIEGNEHRTTLTAYRPNQQPGG